MNRAIFSPHGDLQNPVSIEGVNMEEVTQAIALLKGNLPSDLFGEVVRCLQFTQCARCHRRAWHSYRVNPLVPNPHWNYSAWDVSARGVTDVHLLWRIRTAREQSPRVNTERISSRVNQFWGDVGERYCFKCLLEKVPSVIDGLATLSKTNLNCFLRALHGTLVFYQKYKGTEITQKFFLSLLLRLRSHTRDDSTKIISKCGMKLISKCIVELEEQLNPKEGS